MTIKLYPNQQEAVNQLKTGSILCGGVGSGKSITSLVYYFMVECDGERDPDGDFVNMKKPKDLFIITTANKRDTLDWERECAAFPLSRDRTASINGVKVTVDSWNNITKYVTVKGAFFIFDEQRVVGSGVWVKSFLKITKENNWILLSATPGDTWLDYIPVFVANGFYKNQTEFKRQHVVYNTFTKYPKVDRYVEEAKLYRLKKQIMVYMEYLRPTEIIREYKTVSYDSETYDLAKVHRWNPYENRPIRDVSEYCYTLRKIINSDVSRLNAIGEIVSVHRRVIVFYNFNYELDMLRKLKGEDYLEFAEYNGHKHEPVPKSQFWIYAVQYNSGAEGWNCIETNTIAFYSLNYSYRMMTQAAGRVDRLNTPFAKLYYYQIISEASIDMAIVKALREKRDFNDKELGFRLASET